MRVAAIAMRMAVIVRARVIVIGTPCQTLHQEPQADECHQHAPADAQDLLHSRGSGRRQDELQQKCNGERGTRMRQRHDQSENNRVAWRALLLDGRMDWHALGTAALIAVVAVVVGQAVFDRLQWKFAEAL